MPRMKSSSPLATVVPSGTFAWGGTATASAKTLTLSKPAGLAGYAKLVFAGDTSAFAVTSEAGVELVAPASCSAGDYVVALTGAETSRTVALRPLWNGGIAASMTMQVQDANGTTLATLAVTATLTARDLSWRHGWTTIYDVDFTAQANHDFLVTPTLDIAGATWTAAGGAFTSAFAIQNGTGLVVTTSASGVTAFSAPISQFCSGLTDWTPFRLLLDWETPDGLASDFQNVGLQHANVGVTYARDILAIHSGGIGGKILQRRRMVASAVNYMDLNVTGNQVATQLELLCTGYSTEARWGVGTGYAARGTLTLAGSNRYTSVDVSASSSAVFPYAISTDLVRFVVGRGGAATNFTSRFKRLWVEALLP